MTIVYARVSTDEQDARSQLQGLTDALRGRGVDPEDHTQVRVITDSGVGGAVEWRKRGLGKAFRLAKKGDTIMASEISRLARNLGQLYDFVGACHDKGVGVETIKDGWKFEDTIQSKMIMVFVGLAAEIERAFLVQRTKEGIERARREGKHVGRPKGSKKNILNWRALMRRFFGCESWDGVLRRLQSDTSATRSR